jgi:hypothetical protein
VKKIYAITFFSALLVLGNENNILANSNLSSLETNDLIVTETNNSTFEEIEMESGISITYDLDFNKIIGYTVPGELSDTLSEQELNMLILKEVGNVLLNQSEEFQRIQNIINEANSEKIQEQRIQYRYPITISIGPRASRNFPLRGVAVGEKVFYNISIQTTRETTKASGVTMNLVDENTGSVIHTVNITSNKYASYTNTSVFRPIRAEFKNNTSSSLSINGFFNLGF